MRPASKHAIESFLCKVLLQMFKKLQSPLSLLSKLNNMAKLVTENSLDLIHTEKVSTKIENIHGLFGNKCVGLGFVVPNVL